MNELPVIVALTGASGQPYGIRLLQVLLELHQPVELVVSEAAFLVLKEELGLEIPPGVDPIPYLLGKDAETMIHYHPASDLGADIASGSHLTKGMVICPCSTGTLGSIASGVSRNLIERSADVCLKEQRKLVLVVREMPLSPIHLKNMHELSLAGAVIMPASPGFYHQPQTVQEMIDFVIARILDQLGIPHKLAKRWKEGV